MKRSVKIGIVLVVVAVVAIAIGTAGHGKPAKASDQRLSNATPSPTTTIPVPATTTPSPPPVTQTITYIATGPGDEDVIYGPDGSSNSATGDVNVSAPGPLTSDYYSIDANDVGDGGPVSCTIQINGATVTTHTATGAYSDAMCEITKDPITGNWQST